jgi:formylglycine-generating enzyme required for sulfatase activity
MDRRRFGLLAATLTLGLPGCDQGQSLAPEAHAAAPPWSTPEPRPRPASTTIASGPCAGKNPGERACDADKLVRCQDLSGQTTVENACDGLSTCDAAAGTCAPACPAGEVYVPPTGPDGFTMGTAEQGTRDKPHKVVLTRPFCMDASETTVAAYKACVEKQGCTPPRPELRWSTYPDRLDYPVNKVSWPQSKYFCEQQGKSLPSEAQWEWAATGGDGRKWPWGNEAPTCDHADFIQGLYPYNPDCENALKGYRRCNGAPDAGCGGGGPSAVATHLKGDKVWPSGAIHDLGGNLWEWVLDNLDPYHEGVKEVDPLHLSRMEAVHGVRGGGWNRSGRGILAAFRGGAVHGYQVSGLGFRCVRNPPGSPAPSASASNPSGNPGPGSPRSRASLPGPGPAAAPGSATATSSREAAPAPSSPAPGSPTASVAPASASLALRPQTPPLPPPSSP